MRLDPLPLKLLISVVERGSIAAAGDYHIAPAATIKRISELESACAQSPASTTQYGRICLIRSSA
jgi:hypothetical protein